MSHCWYGEAFCEEMRFIFGRSIQCPVVTNAIRFPTYEKSTNSLVLRTSNNNNHNNKWRKRVFCRSLIKHYYIWNNSNSSHQSAGHCFAISTRARLCYIILLFLSFSSSSVWQFYLSSFVVSHCKLIKDFEKENMRRAG